MKLTSLPPLVGLLSPASPMCAPVDAVCCGGGFMLRIQRDKENAWNCSNRGSSWTVKKSLMYRNLSKLLSSSTTWTQHQTQKQNIKPHFAHLQQQRRRRQWRRRCRVQRSISTSLKPAWLLAKRWEYCPGLVDARAPGNHCARVRRSC